MSKDNNMKNNNNAETSNITDTVVAIAAGIGGLILGKILGLLGIGAIAIGWFTYDRTKENLGRFVASCAGAAAGLAAYGLAMITIFS